MAKLLPITESFAKIQAWAREHAPGVRFNPPAKPSALENFSEKSGLPVPEEMSRAWLVADGESRKSAGMIGNWRMMPIAEIQAAWGLLTKITEKGGFSGKEPVKSPYLRQVWWHASWIPVVASDTGHYFCIATDPPEAERSGQVLLFLQDQPERPLVDGSLRAWFDRIRRDLEAGRYAYDPEEGFDGEGFLWSALEGKHLFEDNRGKRVVGF